MEEERTTLAAETIPPAIITVQYKSFYAASVHGDADKWKSGNTKEEAIGKLHMAYPALFGVVMIEEQS